MSSEALLKAIETAGQEALAQLEQETSQRVEEILSDAKDTAESRRKEACQEAQRPLATERARRLHEARMEALKITAAARDKAAERLQAKVQSRLSKLRSNSEYRAIFRHLFEEAVQMLGEQEIADSGNGSPEMPSLEIDGRDGELARDLLKQLDMEMDITTNLSSWGGVVVRSGDGRIVVTNTLEARLAQLEPYLERFIP